MNRSGSDQLQIPSGTSPTEIGAWKSVRGSRSREGWIGLSSLPLGSPRMVWNEGQWAVLYASLFSLPSGLSGRSVQLEATSNANASFGALVGLVPADATFLHYTRPIMQPIYTTDNTNPAFQLNWSVALFGKENLPANAHWIDQLRDATEPDGVRILEHHHPKPNVVQFLVSTTPILAPSQIVRSLKGRLQHLLRSEHPKLFRRNYSILSIGEAKADQLDQYIASQTDKHPMADRSVQARFDTLQYHNPDIDLAAVQTGNYGHYLHSLQIVLEMGGGWHEVRLDILQRIRNIIISCAAKKAWQLSRIGLLSNHLHMLIGANVKEIPADIALSLMNNIAFVYEMKPVLRYSYYVGTFGEYDRGVVRKDVATDRDKLDGALDQDDPIR